MSDEIQRYKLGGGHISEREDGAYVRNTDHVAARAEQNAAWVARIEKAAKGHQGRAEQAGRKADYKDSQLWMTRKYEEEAASDALLDLLKEVDDGE